MGAYLSHPITEKDCFSGHHEGWLSYGGASMQGWRRSQEDAHCVHIAPGFAFFSIFDGHGGAECSSFTKKYMLRELLALKEQLDLSQALTEVFHKMDAMLKEPKYRTEIEELKRRPNDVSLASPGEHSAAASPVSPPPGGGPPAASSTAAPAEGAEQEQPFSKVDALSHLREMLDSSQPAGLLEEEAASDAADVSLESVPAPAVRDPGSAGEPGGAAAGSPPGHGGGGTAPPPSDRLEGAPSRPQQQARRPSYDDASVAADHLVQAGCTAVVAVIEGTHLYVANAGDSRAVMCRDATAVPLSQDHKPASQRERERIQAAGGFISEIGGVVRVNGNLNLSRAIGDLRYKDNDRLPVSQQIITAEPDIIKEQLVATDRFLVLACDGVWDVKTNQEVVDFVRERLAGGKLSLAEISSQLLDACLAPDPRETRGIGCDNMTALILSFDPKFARPEREPEAAKWMRRSNKR